MIRFMSRHKRLLRIIGAVFLLLLVAVYIGLPAAMALAVVRPDGTSAGAVPNGFTEVTLETEDGLALAAWYAESQNGATIILVHGSGSGRSSLRDYALMLRENGFGVLALDLRGYGDSEGSINRLGWNSTPDVGAAVAYLVEQEDADVIGGLGLSMGGEVLLGAASAYPQIGAIATDGATFRSVSEYTAMPSNRPLYRNFTHRVFTFMATVVSGDAPPEPPLLASMQQAADTAFLFIAAGNNATEVDFNEFYHEALADRSRLWIVPDVAHTGGFAHDPQSYEAQVVSFFRHSLLNE